MANNSKTYVWVGLILAGLVCALIPSFILYRQSIPEQPMYQFLHGTLFISLESLDILEKQGKIRTEDLSRFALDENLPFDSRVAAIRKLGEKGAASFPVLIEVLVATDLRDAKSRNLASFATFELSRNNGITDEVIPIIFNTYTTLPPWDESFRPKEFDLMQPSVGGWYGCIRDELIDESWVAIFRFGEKAIPALSELSIDDNPEIADAAAALINEIQTGQLDTSHQNWSCFDEIVWRDDKY